MRTENFLDYEDAITMSCGELEKGYMALQDFLDTYSWNIELSPQKALKYGSSTHPDDCTLDEKMSFKLLAEYNKITWLIQVASDYCFNASELLKKALEHEEVEISESDSELSYYRNEVDTILSNIDNCKYMRKIYSFIKGFVD